MTLAGRMAAAFVALVVVLAALFALRDSSTRTSGGSPAPASPVPTNQPASASGRSPHLQIGHGPVTLRETKTVKITDGVVLHYIEEPTGPNQIRVLEVDPQTAVTLDLVGAGERYPELAPTSRMAQRDHALAGVNGEFFSLPGRPEFLFQSDAVLWQTALHASNMFAISEDEEEIYVDRIDPEITAFDSTSGLRVRVSEWNTTPPKGARIVAYTPIGGTVARAPSHACYVLLSATAAPQWTDNGDGIARSYSADRSGCGERPPAFDGADSIVLVAEASAAGRRGLDPMEDGHHVRVTWSVGLRNVIDIAGGQPVLVKRGRSQLPPRCKTSFCLAQPRTAVGYTEDGIVLIATVDGRQPGWSVGMSLHEWSQVWIQLGAEGALNLDGGGSTTMWVRGQGVVNRPSNPGRRERSVGTALVVLPGQDSGVPDSLVS
jgi:hypothetical protein